MPSIHSSDINTVNNLRGSSPLLSLWSQLTVRSVSAAGITTTQGDKGSHWKRETASQMTSYTPCSDLHRFTAVWPVGRSTVVHYMAVTVWCQRDRSPVQLLRRGPTLVSGRHIWWKIVAASEVTMCRRWPRESVRPLQKCRYCCPPRSRKWNTSLCQWMTTRVLPFAFL